MYIPFLTVSSYKETVVIKQFNYTSYDVDDFHWLKFVYMAVPYG